MESRWTRSPVDADAIELARVVETIEAAAFADAYDAIAGAGLGTSVLRVDGAIAIRMARMPPGPFNRVVGLGLEAPATAELIARITAWYGDTVPWFQPSPAARPAELPALLAAAGHERIGFQWGKFARGTEPPAPIDTDLEIREIDAGGVDDFARVAEAGFGLPPFLLPWVRALPGRERWRCYVGYAGDEPATCGATYREGDAMFVGFGGTRPELRGRGGQRAMLARRVADGIAAGVRTFATETGLSDPPGPSWRNITRAGFELLYLRDNYTAPVIGD